MVGRELEAFEQRRDALIEKGVPEELAVRVAVCPPAYMILGMVQTAARDDRDPIEVARVHFEVGERLGLPMLVVADPGAAARRPVADDGPGRAARRPAHRARPADRRAELGRATRHRSRGGRPGRSRTLQEICSDEDTDLARLSVALRVVRSLL